MISNMQVCSEGPDFIDILSNVIAFPDTIDIILTKKSPATTITCD